VMGGSHVSCDPKGVLQLAINTVLHFNH
jgi:hypothetical protein